MKTNKIGSNFYPQSSMIFYLAFAACFLIWNLSKAHFLILLSNLQPLVIGLLLYSLFVDTKHIKIKLDWWVYFSLFGLIAFLSTHGSYDYLVSSIKIGLDFYIVAFCFLFYVVFFEQIPKMATPTLLLVVLVFVLVAAPVTVSEIIFQTPSDDRQRWSQGYDLTSLFDFSYYNHIRHFSYHAFIASCCAYILLKGTRNSTLFKLAAWLLFAVCFGSMLLAYGRGSILAFLAFVAMDSYFGSGIAKALKVTGVVILAVGCFYAILYFTPIGVITEFLFSSFLRGNEVAQQDIALSVNAVSSGRSGMWIYAIERALESPFYGHGPSSAKWLFAGTGHAYAAQPHNSVVQFVMDFGFLGAAILIFMFAKALHKLTVKFNPALDNEPLRRSLVCFVLAFLVFSLTDGLLYHPLPMTNFFLILAVLVALNSSVRLQRLSMLEPGKA
jgi:O-antigen ligase